MIVVGGSLKGLTGTIESIKVTSSGGGGGGGGGASGLLASLGGASSADAVGGVGVGAGAGLGAAAGSGSSSGTEVHIFVLPDREDLRELCDFAPHELRKHFQLGDHVKVLAGKCKDLTGMVVKVRGGREKDACRSTRNLHAELHAYSQFTRKIYTQYCKTFEHVSCA